MFLKFRITLWFRCVETSISHVWRYFCQFWRWLCSGDAIVFLFMLISDRFRHWKWCSDSPPKFLREFLWTSLVKMTLQKGYAYFSAKILDEYAKKIGQHDVFNLTNVKYWTRMFFDFVVISMRGRTQKLNFNNKRKKVFV